MTTPDTQRKTASAMVAHAKAHIENLSPAQVADELRRGDVLLVDLRESEERARDGVIPGSVHAPRGMLEFYADPTSQYHRPEFDPNKRVIVHCSLGGRSALAADTLQQMGYRSVAHLDGGIKAWKEQGQPTQAP
jgi:rhodanese-related sulfurtransferase